MMDCAGVASVLFSQQSDICQDVIRCQGISGFWAKTQMAGLLLFDIKSFTYSTLLSPSCLNIDLSYPCCPCIDFSAWSYDLEQYASPFIPTRDSMCKIDLTFCAAVTQPLSKTSYIVGADFQLGESAMYDHRIHLLRQQKRQESLQRKQPRHSTTLGTAAVARSAVWQAPFPCRSSSYPVS